MSAAPQKQPAQPAQKNDNSNEIVSGPKKPDTSKAGNNIRKDEPTAQGGIKNEGGNSASSDKQGAQSDGK